MKKKLLSLDIFSIHMGVDISTKGHAHLGGTSVCMYMCIYIFF